MRNASLLRATTVTLVAVVGLLLSTASAEAAVTTGFSSTGAEQTFVVPAGVYSLHVLAVGGSGAAVGGGGAGGAGGQVSADIEVTPGETLYVDVGGNASGETGGFNGGGAGKTNSGGGGGASDVRTVPSSLPSTLEHRLLVAAGGGGGGALGETIPGAGGNAGSPGGNEVGGGCGGTGGGAGTSTEGGKGGVGDENGANGVLGAGGAGGVFEANGGGGGGGLYGGGGGGACDGNSGAGGGGGSSLVPAGGSFAVASGAAPQVQISYEPPQGFAFTGGEQTFTVPAGVTSVHVLAVGGRGGSSGGLGGEAALVSGNLTVTPGEILYLEVGGNGRSSGAGGFNGGGTTIGAGGGGGASDVRTVSSSLPSTLEHRLLVAAGGGGGGALSLTTPGAGGNAGSPGANEGGGVCEGGGAGTSTEGGKGGEGDTAGGAGALGVGGVGGVFESNGGGGGAGLYGGGGGGGCDGDSGAGGGGGSSLVPAGAVLELATLDTAPSIQISYTPPPSTKATSAGTPSKAAPVISGASESHKVWRESNALAKVSKKARPPVGTTFSFSLDQPATVTFTFKAKVTGRKVKGKCVAKTKKNQHKSHCQRTTVAGKFTFSGHAGVNKVQFAGRVSSSLKLRPGSYSMVITAVNAEHKASPAQSLTFTIVH